MSIYTYKRIYTNTNQKSVERQAERSRTEDENPVHEEQPLALRRSQVADEEAAVGQLEEQVLRGCPHVAGQQGA